MHTQGPLTIDPTVPVKYKATALKALKLTLRPYRALMVGGCGCDFGEGCGAMVRCHVGVPLLYATRWGPVTEVCSPLFQWSYFTPFIYLWFLGPTLYLEDHPI